MSSGLKDNFKGDSYEKIIGILAAALFLTALADKLPNNNYYTGNNNCDDCSTIDNSHLNITKDGQAIQGGPFTLTFKEGDNLQTWWRQTENRWKDVALFLLSTV